MLGQKLGKKCWLFGKLKTPTFFSEISWPLTSIISSSESVVWCFDLAWTTTCNFLAHLLSQNGHLKGRILSWTSEICFFKCPFSPKLFPQMVHKFSFSPLWVWAICLFRLSFLGNDLPHSGQRTVLAFSQSIYIRTVSS